MGLARSARPSTVVDLLLIHVVLRLEAEALALGFLPGGRAQVARVSLALAAVELGHLAKLQRVAFAGAAGEIIDDAAAHGLERLACRATEVSFRS